MINFILWIVFGALVGWIASIIMKSNASMGALANIIAGIVGSFVGGWVMSLFGQEVAQGQFNIPSMLTAILGACIVIFIAQKLKGKR